MYAKAQAVCERDGPEWTVHRLVKEALQQMNGDEALAVALASSSPPAELRAFMAFWLSDAPDKEPPQIPANASYGDKEVQLLTQLIGEVCTAEAVAAAKVADQTLGDYVCEKLSRTDDDALPGGLSATLPPLRGQPEFPRYSVNQVASLPCGAHVLRQKLKQFWTKECEFNDTFCHVDLWAGAYYEACRHHPLFQREAAALRNFLESQRELSALLTEINDEEVAERGLTPPWPVNLKSEVAA